jgi:hypothetical protein
MIPWVDAYQIVGREPRSRVSHADDIGIGPTARPRHSHVGWLRNKMERIEWVRVSTRIGLE